MAIYKSILDLVGGTPLVELTQFEKENDLKATVLAKLEYFNPAGSVKDRIAKAIVEDAEKSGKLQPGGTIIEPTSGNTGIGLAAVAAAKKYAGDHERGAPQPDESLWRRAGAHRGRQGHEGRHRQG